MRINHLILKSSLLCLLLVAAQQVLAQSPGGVTGALMWVRADSGMTTSGAGPTFSITGWTNQANTTKNLKPFGTPIANDTANVNFNPVAIFNGSSSLYSDSVIESSSSNHTRFVVFKSHTTAAANIIGSGKPVSPVADAASVLMQPGSGAVLQQWVAGFGFYGNTAPITISKPQMAASRYAAGVSNGTYIRINGVSNVVSTNTAGFLANRVQLGAAYNVGGATNVNYLTGAIAEVAIYGSALTAAQMRRVESYLSLKYGLTLSGDYIASNLRVIWDSAANVGFLNNIAGIGRDSTSSLLQKQSKSVNSGFQPIIALNSIASTNKLNTSTALNSVDTSFLIWGDNNGSTAFATAITFSGISNRMARVWKVQETGTIGNILVAIPASSVPLGLNNLSLLTSGSSSFSTGVTATLMSLQTISGIKYYTATIDFTSGQFFTFGGLVTSPGGVATGLRMWLRADKGSNTTTEGSSVDTVFDASINGFDALAPTPAVNKPVFRAANSSVAKDFNFNPYLDMTVSGTNKKGMYNNEAVYTSNNDNGALFMCVQHSGAVPALATTLMSVSRGSPVPSASYMDQAKLFITSSSSIQWFASGSSIVGLSATINDPNAKPTVYGVDWTGSTAASKVIRISSEGIRRATSAPAAYLGWSSGASNQFAINEAYSGGITGDNSGSFYASEFIAYNSSFSDLDMLRVNSYLSLKYGNSMSNNLDGDGTVNEMISGSIREGDYVASDGSTIVWTANSTYDSCIAGIGRDDLSDLNQKQSKGVDSTNQVVMSLGAVQATNALNTNTFSSDKQFLVWAHDGSSDATFTATGNSSYPKRFTRIWKTQNTNSFAQDIRVYYPVTAFGNAASSTVALLYGSSAASLSSGSASVIVQSDTTTINGARYYEFAVPAAAVPNLQFFSFTAFTTSPGGVSASLWYKADAGISKSSDSVTQWNNVSGSGLYNAAPSAATNRPLHAIDSAYINFNPSVSFDGVNDQLIAASMPLNVVTQGSGVYGNSQYVVYRAKTVAGFAYAHNSTSGGNPSVAAATGGSGSMTYINNTLNTNAPLVNQVRMQSLDGNTSNARAYLNGSAPLVGAAGTVTILLGTQPFYIGSLNAAGGFSKSDIAEIVICNDSVNTRRRRIESYLAIKYGISIDQVVPNNAQDYVSSTGRVIWPTSTSYIKNVFGIGRDDVSGLHQQVSRSTTNGTTGADSLFVSTDNNFVDPNGSHAALPNDTSFLLIGHNNGSFNVNTSMLGGLTTVNTRTQRVWRVIESGVVPTVYLRAKGVTAPYMVVSADSTFSTGVTVVPLSGEITSYNFPAGTSYMAFAQLKKAPGSITDDYLVWYQANNGVTTGATFVWTDQFSGQTATQAISTKQPTLDSTTNRINFNPVLRFDGTDDRLRFTSTTGMPTSSDSVALYYVARNNALASAGLIYHHGATTGTNTAFLSGKNAANALTAGSVIGGTASIASAWSPAGQINLVRAGYEGGSSKSFYVVEEGKSIVKSTTVTPIISTASPTIGARNDSTQHWNGDIAEVILYSDNHNGKNSSVQVESYLAVKYGMTLGSKSAPVSYLNTVGNVTWTGSSTYQAHVIGLGRDSITDLDQRITTSTDAGDVLILSMDNNFTANNLQHSGITNNLSFFMVGNDSASVSTFITTEKPATYSSRIPREWRVQTTNFSQNVNLRFTGFGSTTTVEWYLLKKNGSSDFTSGATEVVKLNANGDATGITLNNDDYFTLMRKNLIDCIMVNPGTSQRLKVP